MKKFLLFSAFCCLLFNFGVQAQKIIYVKADATGVGDGSSWANAFTDFQAGVSAALRGDEVFVAGGTYQPDAGGFFTMKEGVKIYGGFAGTESSLDQRNLNAGNTSVLKGNGNSVIVNDDNGLTASALLDGFTITGGNSSVTGGGGMENNNSSPSVSNCVFLKNHASLFGGGMYNIESYSSVSDCIFLKNTAQYGGGISTESGKSSVINCTFWENTAEDGGGVFDNGSTFINCIIYGNSSGIYNAGGTTTINYSIVQGGYEGIGNTDKDPLFVDAVDGNFQLQPGSPAINKGTPDITGLHLPTTDLAGNARVSGGMVDMGAYEYQGNPVHPDANGILYVDSSDVNNSFADGSSWAKALDHLSDAIAVADTNTSVKEIHLAKGTYYPTGDQGGTGRDSTFLITRTRLKIIGGYPAGGGAIDGTAHPTILSGDIGTVADNTDNSYHVMVISDIGSSSDSLVIAGITFTKGNANGSDTTVLNGRNIAQNDGGGIMLDAASATGKIFFDSCRFSGNNAGHGGGMYNTNTSAVFNDCAFSGNYCGMSGESSGGGIENGDAAALLLMNCKIAGNQAPLGGGVINDENSSSTFINCIITGNNALTGGGLYDQGAAPVSLLNCTVSGNYVSEPSGRGAGGGIQLSFNAACTLTNCIVWGNSGGIDGGAPTVNYSLVQDWTGGGTGNRPGDTDPEFITAPAYSTAPFTTGDYQLLSGSPVINKGNNTALPAADTLDPAGNRRIFDKANGGIVDLGAYEYPLAVIHLPSGKLDTATAGVVYDTTYKATGGTGPYTYSLTDGQLPAGLTLAGDGELSGTPTEAGDFAFVVTVGDQNGIMQQAKETLTVNPPVMTLHPANLVPGFEQVAYSQAITVAGGTPPYTYSYSTTGGETGLPGGLSLNGNTISGIPQATGTFTFTISAADNTTGKGSPFNISGTYTLVIKAAGSCISLGAEPVSQAVCEGTDATFTVTATGATGYQWQSEPAKGNAWSDIPGATGATLTVPNVTLQQSAMQYRVRIMSANCGSLLSTPATLTVNPVTAITLQPENASVCDGGDTSFTVKATGSNLTYLWQSSADGNIWNNVNGGTDPTLELPKVQASENGTQYRVIVNGTCSSVTSRVATLTASTGPVISRQPQSQSVFEGSDVAFSVTASGIDLQYQWQYLPPESIQSSIQSLLSFFFNFLQGQHSAPAGRQWEDIADVSGPGLSLSNVSRSDNGTQYRVVITGACREVISAPATLTIIRSTGNPNPPGQNPDGCRPPAIKKQPEAQAVCAGANATFSVTASGEDLTYQWQTSANNWAGSQWHDITGASGAALTLSPVTADDDGNYYRVRVTNGCGAVIYTNPVRLAINKVAGIQIQPKIGFALEGASTYTMVVASGDVTGYQWQLSTDQGQTWLDISGATGNTLQIDNLTDEDNGKQFRVIVKGICNTITSDAVTLNVSTLNTLLPFLNGLPGKGRANQRTAQSEYMVYPDPVTHSELTVKDQSGQPLGSISLYNASGQRVLQTRTDNSQVTIQLPEVTPGVYFLRITDKHRNTYSEKIIVQATGTTSE